MSFCQQPILTTGIRILPSHSSSPNDPHDLIGSDALPILFFVISFYGVAFGAAIVVVGGFAGTHVIIGGVCHMAVGIGFALSCLGIACERPFGYVLGCILSGLIAALAIVGVFEGTRSGDSAVSAFWGFLLVFFLVVTFVTRRAFYKLSCIQGSRTKR